MATILVVDDDRAVLRLAECMLQDDGHRVHAAESATEAIGVAKHLQCKLDLLITDMVMPLIDGHDLILMIRRMCPSVNTMAMSGFLPDNSSEQDYLVLPKPFTQDQLLAAVKQILDAQETGGG